MFHRPRSESENTTASEGDNENKENNNKANEQANNPAQAKVADKAVSVPSSSSPASSSVNSKIKESPMNKDEKEKNTPSRPLDIPGQSGYQPPSGAQAPRIPGSYNPGGYAGTNNGQKSSERANVAGEGRRLLIGPGITMSGEIESCDFLVVEGTVEAALKGASVLEITETGTFYGTVEIDEATVAGRFEGDITVNGRLTITESGSITGTIAYKELAIEAGAKLDGKVSPLTGKAVAKTEKTESASKTKEARGKTEAASQNDNSDSEELPFEATAAAAE